MNNLINEAIHNVNKDETGEGFRNIIDIIDIVVQLANIARGQGLLAMEEALDIVQENKQVVDFKALNFGANTIIEKFIRHTIMMIVDGTDPELVKYIGELQIAANYEDDLDLVLLSVALEGCLSIQAGENPRILEEKLKSFIAFKHHGKLEKILSGD